jgi:small subunit ribosomal protein S6
MQERLYDLIFIARPATPEDEVKKVLATIEHACAEKGAKIEKTEHWGTRKLAYKVMKHREGIYVYQQLRTSNAELVHEIERRLGVLDSVIKYQTVRLKTSSARRNSPTSASCAPLVVRAALRLLRRRLPRLRHPLLPRRQKPLPRARGRTISLRRFIRAGTAVFMNYWTSSLRSEAISER